MASAPAYASTPRTAFGRGNTANTNRDGTGTIVDILTGVAAGTRIERVRVKAEVTTTAGMIRIYLYDGTNYRLYTEIVVSAVTVAASTPAFEAEIVTPDLILPSSSYKLAFSTHNAEMFVVWAHGGDLT